MGIIIRQSIKGTIVTYIGVFIGLINTLFILPHYLTEEEIGLSRVLIDAAMLFMGLAQLGTSSSIIRFYPYFKDDKHKDHGFFFWTLVIPFAGFCLFCLLYCLLKVPISNLFIEKSPLFVDYYYFVIPLAFFLLYQAVFDSNANVLMRVVVPKFIREVVVRLLNLVAYLLYAFHIITLDGFVIALCGVYAAATLCNIIYVFSLKKVSIRPDIQHITKPLAKNYLFYTLFLITAALGSAVTPYINTFFISVQMGLAYTGIFAIASYIATMIEIPYRSLGAISQVHLSENIKENNTKATNSLCQKVSLHQWLAGLFLFFFIWINIDLIFQIMPNGERYASGKWVVLLLGFSKLLNSTANVSSSALSYSKYYYYSLIFMFILTAAAIIFNNIFIPLWGMNGAALASLSAYAIYYVLLLALVNWKIKVSIFSIGQLKVVAIIVLLGILNGAWTTYLLPVVDKFVSLSAFSFQLIESVIRSAILLLVGSILIYKWKISLELNTLIDTYVLKRQFSGDK